MLQTEQESRKDVNIKTAQLVQLLTEIGPDIPEIARRLGQFKESVRYRYKEKILGNGFAVQAAVDHERLGLQRVMAVVDFSDEYRPYAESILSAMNELCYLVSFAKTTPQGSYVVSASVPTEYVSSFKELFLKLTEKNLFRTMRFFDFEHVRVLPMRAEFYDFTNGLWDFDWASKTSGAIDATSVSPSAATSFDYVDLLIIKELQMSANKSLAEIANKLKINYKKLAWHYVKHVDGNRLIKGYKINWTGTTPDLKYEKANHKRHSYMIIDLLVRDVTSLESMTLSAKFSKMPFVVGEATGRNYYAQIAIPLNYASEALHRIEEIVEKVRDKMEYYVHDQSKSLAFTISYQLYDQEAKKWAFDSAGILGRFENLLIKISEAAG